MSKRKHVLKTSADVEPKACPFPPKLPSTPGDYAQVPRVFEPLPPSSFFKLGFWGMVLLAISSALAYIFTIGLPNLPLGYVDYGDYLYIVLVSLPHWFIAGGFLLSGFIFISYWRQTASKLALSTATFSFFSAGCLIITTLLLATGHVFYYSEQLHEIIGSTFVLPSPGPLYLPYSIAAFLGVAALTFTMTLWAISLMRLPRHPKHRFLPIITSLFCIWGAIGLLPPLPSLALWIVYPTSYLPQSVNLLHLIQIIPTGLGRPAPYIVEFILFFLAMKLVPAATLSSRIFYDTSPESIKTRSG